MQFLQYKMAHNKWPTSFEEIGYASSDMRDDEYIENIIIGDGGKIYALLNNKFGTNMVVMLMQEEIMGGMHLRSKCLTNLPKSVTSMISVCKSVKKISLPH